MRDEFTQPADIGLWRYGIISPLLHSVEGDAPLVVRTRELSRREFCTPDGRVRRYSPDTICDWLRHYRACGIDGLRKKPRKDRGATSVSQILQSSLADMRKSQPSWTTRRILSDLRERGIWNGHRPGKSVLYRFIASHGLSRSAVVPAEPVRSFEYPFFGDLWSADFLHGPKVRRGTHAFKSYLHAIIDDATRYVVVARFHFAEDTRSLLDDLMLATTRFGIPKRFYTDNGAAFRSRHLRQVAARLTIALPHTPAYKPRGRGKIERFFRTVRDSLLTGRPRTTLEKLNADLGAWINEYHTRVHRTLGMTPLERKLADAGPELRRLPSTGDSNSIFRMEELKRIGSDGCVRMFKRRFDVPDAIPASFVTVSYLPWDQSYILVGPEKRRMMPLNSINNALRFDKPQRGKSTNQEEAQ